MKKTKEEILNARWAHWADFRADHPLSASNILEAMNDFADQQTASLRSEIASLRSKLDDCKRRAITGQRI